MLEKFRIYFRTHRSFLVGTSAAFLFFCFLVIGPLFVEAVLTLSDQQSAAILQKNSAIEAAILNNDYITWSSLVSDDNLKSKINAGNFVQYADAYRLLQQGKVEEANIIKKQLALKQNFAALAVKSQAIEAAIDGNNYTAWRAAVGNSETKVDSSNFTAYVESYKLIRQGNLAVAQPLQRVIGLSRISDEAYYSSSR
ncbi:MAG: hypothetical protein WC249_04310 [Patescibacteria group bacterium]|jgi:uncharacterized protein YtpQ (UPF0354 family)